MNRTLTAPQTISEWQIVAAGLLVLSTIMGYAASNSVLYAIIWGLFGAVFWTVILMIIVFSWRGFRSLFSED
ncbi:hypothetical protein [Saliphagus infecundisoli]|uniref:Uncharacterized protein n=1 Tax=Saliphagus infecundisoli TaxID=1849069 RepID=A0ABD5Q9I7_9EURY|nr:hypothetical protein [Saliphagus infecundisoli]